MDLHYIFWRYEWYELLKAIKQLVATKTTACNWSTVLFDFIVRIHFKAIPSDMVGDTIQENCETKSLWKEKVYK